MLEDHLVIEDNNNATKASIIVAPSEKYKDSTNAPKISANQINLNLIH